MNIFLLFSVIDFCLTKSLVSDPDTNYTSLQMEWASRANCTQILANRSLLFFLSNFIVFGLTRSMLEPTIYRTRGEHANHYTTDAVAWNIK
jgi:hypothetical protein